MVPVHLPGPRGLAHGPVAAAQGALWPRCPHLYSGLGQIRAQSQLSPGQEHQGSGFSGAFLQFLQLERLKVSWSGRFLLLFLATMESGVPGTEGHAGWPGRGLGA